MIDQHDDNSVDTIIHQLEAVLHPEQNAPPFPLTEEMLLPPKPLSADAHRRLISEIGDAIRAQLPAMIHEALDRVLVERDLTPSTQESSSQHANLIVGDNHA
ncbi:MAG: hypothetical protein Q9M26_02485 [Mariprofundales bacterium]|nr:hypothetical protein [Mariprofundales bacterium]